MRPVQRALMIGGTSLIGPHAVRELTQAGVAVWTLTRTGKSYFCETALAGDRTDPAALAAALGAARPDVVIDMIPFTVAEAETLRDAMASHAPAARLVALSSIDVYRASGRLNGTEEAPFQPCPIPEDGALRARPGPRGDAYDKIGVERVYRESVANLTLLRLPPVYGWPDTTRVAGYLDRMLDGEATIKIAQDVSEFRFSRCLHKNAAFAVTLAASPAGGQRVYNVAEPFALTEIEWAERIARCCGWRGRVAVTAWTDGAERPRQDFEVATEAIRRDLGFHEKYDVDAGLSDTVAFHAYLRLGKTYRKYY